MERDINEIIRSKVKEAEQRQLPWRKELVWEKVESHFQTDRPTHVSYGYYIAAASFAIIASLISFFLLVSDKEISNERLDRIALTLEQIENQKKKTPDDVKKEKCVDILISNAKDKQETKQKITTSRREVHSVSTPVVVDLILPEINDTGNVAIVSTNSNEHENKMDATSSLKKKIEPIVGLMPEEAKPMIIVSRRKKIGFHLFKSSQEEMQFSPLTQNHIVVARIK